jgi:hypothetical protein
MKVKLGRDPCFGAGGDPVVPEVAPPQLSSLGADEDVTVVAGGGVVLQMVCDLVEEFVREGDRAHPGR